MEDELRRASFGWSSQVGEFMDPSGGIVGSRRTITVDDGADREYLELTAEVGDDGNQCTTGSEGHGQDGSQHDADDAQGESIEVRGNDFGDAHERTAMMEMPATDGVIPTLDRASSMASDNHEANDDADHEDRYGDSGEDHGSM